MKLVVAEDFTMTVVQFGGGDGGLIRAQFTLLVIKQSSADLKLV